MTTTFRYAVLVGVALALLAERGHGQTTCLDSATHIEIANSSRTNFDFDVASKAVDARGVHWVDIPDHAIKTDGDRAGCWLGGYVEGPYPENSVFECEPRHCPGGVCPTPCWEYHLTAGMRIDTAAPMTLEDVRVSDYGDGIERSVSANRQPLIVKRAYLHDIHDDAIENDWGAAVTVVDSLLERVFIAFASRPRSGEDIDASDRAFEVRDSLILAHRFTHTYKDRAGHEGFWKWPHDGRGPSFIVTGSTFVVTDEISGSLVLPLVDQVLECADNTLLWAGTVSSWNDWLGGLELGSDGLTNAGRVEALSDCFTVLVKPEAQSQADFLAQQFDPLVAAWKQSHPAAGGMPPPECDDGLDNDGDGLPDMEDPGCASADDLSEQTPFVQCDDGGDNDGDGRIDFDPVTFASPGDESTAPAGRGDPGCFHPAILREDPQCQDGLDNDADGGMDYDAGLSALGFADPRGPDLECVDSPWRMRESSRCGLGFELALLLVPLSWVASRRRKLIVNSTGHNIGDDVLRQLIEVVRPPTMTDPSHTPAVRIALIASMLAAGSPQAAGAAEVALGLNFTASTLDEVGFVPPDSMMAVGDDHIVELVNGGYAVYRKADGMRIQSDTLDGFWRAAGVEPDSTAFDPRLLYDPSNRRWFAASIDNFGGPNNILLAVSRSPDPNGGWRGFKIPSDPLGELWAEFPRMGMNAEWVFVATNPFRLGGEFTFDTSLFVASKADLVAATPTIVDATLFRIVSRTEVGINAQPVVDLDASADPGILLADMSIFGFLTLADVEGEVREPVISGGLQIPTEGFAPPPEAPQPGPKRGLDTGGIQHFQSNVIKRGSSLWGVSTVGLEGRPALRWLEIDAVSSEIRQTGLITHEELSFYHPSIAVNDFGDVVIGCSGSSESQFVSSYAFVGGTREGVTIFADPILLKAGVSDYEPFPAGGLNRWGDYSATVVDPTDPQTFWTIQEFVYDTDLWGTQVTQLTLTLEPSSALLGVFSLAATAALAWRVRRG
jgi:hypothetical protein